MKYHLNGIMKQKIETTGESDTNKNGNNIPKVLS